MSQKFLVAIEFPTTLHSEDEVEAAVSEGLHRMAVRAWRDRNGPQSWPPVAFLSRYTEVHATLVNLLPEANSNVDVR